MKKTIPLISALSGCEFTITHLDGRVLRVTSQKGEIMKPGQYKMIEKEGMPTYRDPFNKGHLYIKFEIDFPAKLTDTNVIQLKELLPKESQSPISKNDIEYELTETEIQENNKERNEDDEEERGERVQTCKTA